MTGPLTYRQKLTLALAATSSCAIVLATGALALHDFVSSRAAAVRDLSALARVVGESATAALAFGDERAGRAILEALQSQPDILRAELATADGRTLASFARQAGRIPVREEAPEEGHRFEPGRLLLSQSIFLDRERVGRILLEADLTRLNGRLRQYGTAAVFVLLGAVLFALVLSSHVETIVSRPILELAEAARRVSKEKDYSVRVRPRSRDELGALTEAFNEMLQEIEERDVALRGAQAELERRVEERTRELERQTQERLETERALRDSEEQLRQAQKMEAVGRLAGGIAHDFNNLLTAIQGYSELMLLRLPPRDPLRRHAEEIHKASGRAAALTRQLLAFSRKQVLEPKLLDLNAIVAGMDGMLRRVIGEDVELVSRPADRLGAVHADPGQLEQVILNLAVNARDAMPNGGKLILETRNAEVRPGSREASAGLAPGRYVVLAVTDTGVGMDAGILSRIFEPFFTTKEKGKGTGLGLSTVYGIVKQSGGHVFVRSEPGLGSTFEIYLPRVEGQPEAAAEERQATEPARGRETILLVEDEELVRDFAREVLEMHGYRVLEASGGGEALLLCERHTGPIDLMLTDVVMPHLNGRQLYERLAPTRPEMRVLYMTGYTEDAIVHQGTLDPGTALITKPFTPDALVRKVREMLDAVPARQQPTRA
jgi:signal transduction histidine kinase/CheY-like chemotaxis protein